MSEKKKLVVEAIRNGTVVDHIPADRTLLAVEMLADVDDQYLVGVNLTSTTIARKGIIKFQNKVLKDRELQILAAIAPEATVNIIEEYNIVKKFKLEQPEKVKGLFVCPNLNCITVHEPVTSIFYHIARGFRCHYCERTFPVQRMSFIRPSSVDVLNILR